MRRPASYITLVPRPRKQRGQAQQETVLDEGQGLSTEEQQYDPTSTAFAEFTDVWAIQDEFEAEREAHFDQMVETTAGAARAGAG